MPSDALPKECYQKRPYPMPSNGGEETWASRADDFVVLAYTAGADIVLPDIGYHLVRVVTEAAATPGSLSIRYDGITNAHFPSSSNATNGANAWALDWPVVGSTLKQALFALNGGAAAATLTFSKGKSRGPPIAAYRAIRHTVTAAATHAAAVALGAVNYDVAPAVPRAAYALATKPGFVFVWPTVGTATAGGSADSQPTQLGIHKAPPLPKAFSLNPSYFNPVTAAGTLDLYTFYDPVSGS